MGTLTGWVLALSLGAVVVWEYQPALGGTWVYEDFRMTDACTSELFTEPGQPPVSPWSSSFWRGRFLTGVTWCWHVARGDRATAYHAVNLALHLAMAALVAALVWRLTASALATAAAAAFFAVNAVNVEAVAYLSSRSELIAGLGVVTAVLAALAGRWWLVALALLAGMGGKETAVIGLMLVPLGLWRTRGRLWGWVTALGVIGVLAGVVASTGGTTWNWMRLEMTAMARVLLLSLLPFGQTVDYDYARVPLGLQLGACLALAAGFVWAWRMGGLARLGAAWIACCLVPRLLVPTPLSIFPEHQLYLPLVGMSLVLASLLVPVERTVWI